MGLNISSDQFWKMRPDHFFRMLEAHIYNEQKFWLPFRRLCSIVINRTRGESDPIAYDYDIQWLSMFDKPIVKTTSPKIVLTPEQMRQKAIRAGLIKE